MFSLSIRSNFSSLEELSHICTCQFSFFLICRDDVFSDTQTIAEAASGQGIPKTSTPAKKNAAGTGMKVEFKQNLMGNTSYITQITHVCERKSNMHCTHVKGSEKFCEILKLDG